MVPTARLVRGKAPFLRLNASNSGVGKHKTASGNKIEKRCFAAGLKMTGQRRIIARALSGKGEHPCVEDLYHLAVALDQKISIATVYRTVRLFEEKGIVSRLDFRGDRARYEPSDHGPHYHLIDVDTGAVIEFQDDALEALLLEIAARLGFEAIANRLELFGKQTPGRPNLASQSDDLTSACPEATLPVRQTTGAFLPFNHVLGRLSDQIAIAMHSQKTYVHSCYWSLRARVYVSL